MGAFVSLRLGVVEGVEAGVKAGIKGGGVNDTIAVKIGKTAGLPGHAGPVILLKQRLLLRGKRFSHRLFRRRVPCAGTRAPQTQRGS